MKKIILLISFIPLFLFGQDWEGDNIYVRESLYLKGSTVDSITPGDTIATTRYVDEHISDSSGYADTAGYALQPCKLHVNISKDGNITSFNTLVTLTAYVNETGITYNWDGGAGSNKTLITPITGNHNVVVSKSGCINDTAEIYIVDQTDFHENYNIELPPYSANDTLLSKNYHPGLSSVDTSSAFTATELLVATGSTTAESEDSLTWENGIFNITGIIDLDDGADNIIIGDNSGTNITSAVDNTIIGDQSGAALTEGTDNVGLGQGALNLLQTGTYNTAIGWWSLYATVSGNNNTAVGGGSLYSNTGHNNTALGSQSLYSNTSGAQNTACGILALDDNLTGDNNLGLGYTAGRYGTNLSNRIYINTLNRANLLGDTTLSPIYIYQYSTKAGQKIYLNGMTYTDSIYTNLAGAWADEGLSKNYNYGNFWEDLQFALKNGYLITFKNKSDNWPLQKYLKALAITQERTIRQMADELIIRDNEIIRLERKINKIQLLRNEKLIYALIIILFGLVFILMIKKK